MTPNPKILRGIFSDNLGCEENRFRNIENILIVNILF